MNRSEAIALCRLAQACCPQQKFDEYSPDAWTELLGDLGFSDAKAALVEVAKRQPFVAPSEIRAEVRRIRRKRLETAPPSDPPAGLDPDDELAYRRWLTQDRKRVASGGVHDPELPSAAKPRDMSAIEGTFRSVPDV